MTVLSIPVGVMHFFRFIQIPADQGSRNESVEKLIALGSGTDTQITLGVDVHAAFVTGTHWLSAIG